MTISGKDAWKLHEEIGRRNTEQSARHLAEAKVVAATRGKEPFDLEKLETMCDTSTEGRLAPLEARRARFEEMYYVEFPLVMTLADFARKVDELSKW